MKQSSLDARLSAITYARFTQNLRPLFVLALSLILISCGTSESNVEAGNRTGTLHWGNGTEPQSLDPHIATGVPEHHIIVALMEGLVHKDSKTLGPTPGVPSPGLSVMTAGSTPLNCVTMPAGPMVMCTMPMTLSGPGGVHCSLLWVISMPICTSRL